jgi:hypothetical protein
MARAVPVTVTAQVTVGSVPGIVALAIFLGAALISWAFVPFTDVAALWEWRGPVDRSTGMVVSVHRTRTHVNNRAVLAVDFDHDARRDTSYGLSAPAVGATVDVEYPAGQPDRARIVGMRRRPLPPALLLVPAGLLLAPVVLLAIALVRGLRWLRLLRSGTVVGATLVARDRTHMAANRQRVYRLTYEFQALDGRKGRAIGRTRIVPEKGGTGQVVYDPETLAAAPLSCLPGRPSIDADDTVAAASTVTGVVALALGALALAAWGWLAAVTLQ